jgi:hypothetical protein
MPVTARLSKLFYDRLGEEVAQELVDWFNAVDATYRTDLCELNELNFARFEAKVGERLAVLRSELELKFAESIAGLREDLSDRIRDTKVSLLRWMFAFWIGTAGLILGARLAL